MQKYKPDADVEHPSPNEYECSSMNPNSTRLPLDDERKHSYGFTTQQKEARTHTRRQLELMHFTQMNVWRNVSCFACHCVKTMEMLKCTCLKNIRKVIHWNSFPFPPVPPRMFLLRFPYSSNWVVVATGVPLSFDPVHVLALHIEICICVPMCLCVWSVHNS